VKGVVAIVSDVVSAGHVEMVALGELLPGDSPRIQGEDATHVRNLAKTSEPLPPVVVHRPTMRVIDGMHRVKAARARGDREIAVEYFDGTAADAFLRAVRDNVVHGLPLSRADREAAARRIIQSHAGLSDRAIATVVGLSAPTVGAIRQCSTDRSFQSNSRVGQDGRMRPLSAVDGRLRASRIMAERPEASLRAVARDAKVSLGTAQDVRKRMERGEDPVPARFAAPLVPQPRSAEAPTGQTALHMLRRDPSLRLSETGRALLQWMGVCGAEHRREEIVNAVPEHCVRIIVELARGCAESWTRLGRDLERRTVANG
jgi:hypothetical protein